MCEERTRAAGSGFVHNRPAHKSVRICAPAPVGASRPAKARFSLHDRIQIHLREKRLRNNGAQVTLCVRSVASVGLGKIRRRELLIEMVARCLKHFLRWDLQTALQNTEDSVVARFVNLLLSKDTQSNGFWSVRLPHDLRVRLSLNSFCAHSHSQIWREGMFRSRSGKSQCDLSTAHARDY